MHVLLGWTLFVCALFAVTAGMTATALYLQTGIIRRQKLHTETLVKVIQIQAEFAHKLEAKIDESRKVRLQEARIEKRKRKEAAYNRRRNRVRRRKR